MYQKRTNKETKESAVSPVVGVMLMLVVTIVIAAVVTLFATGLVGDTKVAPTVAVSTNINTANNTIDLDFISVSEPIAMSDLNLDMSSTKRVYNETSEKYEYILYSFNEVLNDNGAIISGSIATKHFALAGGNAWSYIKPQVVVSQAMSDSTLRETYFEQYTTTNSTDVDKRDFHYGNGTLVTDMQGISFDDVPMAYTKIQAKNDVEPGKTYAGDYLGQFVTFNPGYKFNKNENIMMETGVADLKAGDKVDVKLIHTPSNSIIFTKTIVVGV